MECPFCALERYGSLLSLGRVIRIHGLAQAMEAGLREVCRSVRIGKILIQRVRSICFYTLVGHMLITCRT